MYKWKNVSGTSLILLHSIKGHVSYDYKVNVKKKGEKWREMERDTGPSDYTCLT